jgi:hypothetical protein
MIFLNIYKNKKYLNHQEAYGETKPELQILVEIQGPPSPNDKGWDTWHHF